MITMIINYYLICIFEFVYKRSFNLDYSSADPEALYIIFLRNGEVFKNNRNVSGMSSAERYNPRNGRITKSRLYQKK